MENEKVYNVSQVNKYIKMIFEKDNILNSISIKGEITNFKAHYTGHLYFTLKDELSAIKCIMFKSYASLLNFTPKDGDKVVITGQISVFERDGAYQIYCRQIKKEGLGDLYVAYEELKKKLEQEGLFNKERKRKIPFLPERVGVITSSTGAVIKDIINVSTRRFGKVDLLIYPSKVQGVDVAKTVIAGIEKFNELNNVDVIIIARGGGSFEDLFGFNDEDLARTIYKSNIPIISAVGHETDFSISDFVADLRAPTPSAAAEIVYPEYGEILKNISNYGNRIYLATKNYVSKRKQYIEKITAAKLEKAPQDIIFQSRMQIDNIIKKFENVLSLKIQKNKTIYIELISKIEALSPLKTLERGYSVALNKDGHAIKKISDVKKEDILNIRVTDGNIKTKVI